ncbi:MAG: hypothetical protein ABW168_07895 [Sedimenticola sp.]
MRKVEHLKEEIRELENIINEWKHLNDIDTQWGISMLRSCIERDKLYLQELIGNTEIEPQE